MGILTSFSIIGNHIMREYAGEFCIFCSDEVQDGAVSGMPSLNPDQVFLWSKLESGVGELDALVNELAKHSDLSPDDAEGDVQEFLARLMNAGIVEGSIR
jgi:hypothetical protein